MYLYRLLVQYMTSEYVPNVFRTCTESNRSTNIILYYDGICAGYVMIQNGNSMSFCSCSVWCNDICTQNVECTMPTTCDKYSLEWNKRVFPSFFFILLLFILHTQSNSHGKGIFCRHFCILSILLFSAISLFVRISLHVICNREENSAKREEVEMFATVEMLCIW